MRITTKERRGNTHACASHSGICAWEVSRWHIRESNSSAAGPKGSKAEKRNEIFSKTWDMQVVICMSHLPWWTDGRVEAASLHPLRAVLTRQRDPHNSENYCVRSRGGCQLAEPNEINGAYYHFQTYYLHPEVFTLLRRLGMRPYIVRTQQQ